MGVGGGEGWFIWSATERREENCDGGRTGSRHNLQRCYHSSAKALAHYHRQGFVRGHVVSFHSTLNLFCPNFMDSMIYWFVCCSRFWVFYRAKQDGPVVLVTHTLSDSICFTHPCSVLLFSRFFFFADSCYFLGLEASLGGSSRWSWQGPLSIP